MAPVEFSTSLQRGFSFALGFQLNFRTDDAAANWSFDATIATSDGTPLAILSADLRESDVLCCSLTPEQTSEFTAQRAVMTLDATRISDSFFLNVARGRVTIL